MVFRPIHAVDGVGHTVVEVNAHSFLHRVPNQLPAPSLDSPILAGNEVWKKLCSNVDLIGHRIEAIALADALEGVALVALDPIPWLAEAGLHVHQSLALAVVRLDHRHHALAVELTGPGETEELGHRGCEVDQAYGIADLLTRMTSIRKPNREHDVGVTFAVHVEAMIGTAPLVGEIGVPDFLSVVAEEDNHRVVEQAALLELAHDLTDEVVRHPNPGVVDAQVLLRDPLRLLTLCALDVVHHKRGP